MLKPEIRKRLDDIEVRLTPKEWAIRLADEIRRYPCEKDFERALAKGSYRESPYIKPFFMLVKQAGIRYPGLGGENMAAKQKLSRDLRMEYQALKSLINNVTQDVKTKTEKNRLKIDALTNQLNGLISRSAFAGTVEKTMAWMERCKTAEPDEEERALIVKELANVGLIAGSQAFLLSLAQNWADDVAMVLMEILAHKSAVEAVQKKYFDGHAILNLHIEGELEATIRLVEEAIAIFNEYISAEASRLSQLAPSENGNAPAVGQRNDTLTIDAEAIRSRMTHLISCIESRWVTAAKSKATADLLEETGEHGDFLWERFREKVGVYSMVQ